MTCLLLQSQLDEITHLSLTTSSIIIMLCCHFAQVALDKALSVRAWSEYMIEQDELEIALSIERHLPGILQLFAAWLG